MALADEQISNVTSTVNSKLTTVQGWASTAQSTAESAIDNVGTFSLPVITLEVPDTPDLDTPEAPNLGDVPDVTVSNSPNAVTFSETGQVTQRLPDAIPDPVYGAPVAPNTLPSVALPLPPVNYPTVGLPSLPPSADLPQATAPDISKPAQPTLIAISVPDYEFPTLSPFEGVVPEYEAPDLVVNPQVRLAEYDPAALKERISSIAMDTMPVEYVALCERMTDELVNAVDKETVAAVEAAFSKWAAQNFSLPPGMLVGDVNDIQAKGAVKIREGKQKLNNEFFKQTLDNFKTAVQQGMALEKHLIDLHVEHARQIVEAEKLRVKSSVELFNAAVNLFNSHQKARSAYAEAYKTELQARLRVVETYKPKVDGAMAEIAENEARTQMFGSDVKVLQAQAEVYKTKASALTADIEVYKADLLGVKAQADIISANIAAYRDAVKAYAAGVDATSTELNAYAAQVQATVSGAGVYEANARAYASYVQEASKRAGAYKAYVSAQGDVLKANLQTFNAAASTNESFLRAQAAKFSAQAEIASARNSAFATSVRAYTSYNKALSQHNAASLAYAMAASENAARAQALAAQAQAETDKINAGAMAAKAQAKASLAQGAMSAMHVSATAQGSGSTATGANFSYGVNSSWGGNTNKSEVKRQTLSA